MRIAIIGGTAAHWLDLCSVMETLIARSGIFLISVVCGGVQKSLNEGLGYRWAKENGAPVTWVWGKNLSDLTRKLYAECDCLLVVGEVPGAIVNGWVSLGGKVVRFEEFRLCKKVEKNERAVG